MASPIRQDLFDIKNRTIVITGGSGKLGRVFVEALAQAGARIAIFDRVPGLPETDSVMFCPVEVDNRQSLVAGLAMVEARWGVPHGLVNAAAIDSPPDSPPSENGPFEDYPEESWDKVMRVNTKGVFLTCQVIGGAMARAGRGSIVNVASIYGMVSPDQQLYQYRRDRGEVFYKPVAYSASKSAIYNLTRYLAAYWGGKGVRVNTVSFGGVFAGQEQAFLDGYCRKVPLGRMADASEYVGPLQLLLSDAGSYMTGSNLVIDGGFTAL